MPKGYWIGHVDVHNADEYPEYLKTAKAAYEKYGAKFIIRGGASDTVEGKLGSRHIVIEFDSYDTAKACYHSTEYAAARKIRQANADGDIVIVEGVD